MYDMHKSEVVEPVSDSQYKRIVYNRFNLKFKALHKDICNVCDTCTTKLENANDDERKILEAKRLIHQTLAEYARKRIDLKIAKVDEEKECLTFDLENTLPFPVSLQE